MALTVDTVQVVSTVLLMVYTIGGIVIINMAMKKSFNRVDIIVAVWMLGHIAIYLLYRQAISMAGG